MLDSDLALLYGCKNGTKDINKAVKRNLDRFPEDFYFQLDSNELKQVQYSKYNPHVFTEQGVAMLATVLKAKNTASISITIMRTFIEMRKFVNENKNLFRRLTTVEHKMLEYDDNFEKIFKALEPKKYKKKIFFKGEIYDSYSLIINLISEANNRLIITDNYIDKSILDMLVYKKDNVSVEIITSSHYLTKTDINKFNKQYPNLIIKYSNIFHDRFIIIDNDLYHIGSSLKK